MSTKKFPFVPFFVAMVIGASLVAFAAYNLHVSKKQGVPRRTFASTPIVTASPLRALDLKSWPLEKREFSWPNGPHPFTVPVLPEVPVVGFKPGKGPVYESHRINERLRVLIQSHPRAEIREDLSELIESGVIMLSYQIQGGLVASFKVLTPGAIVRSTAPTIDRQPAFAINPRWLAGLTPEQVANGWLVFFHEYQHYLQFARGDTFIASTGVGSIEKKLEVSDCIDAYWHTELEAYEAECFLAKEWNVHFFEDVCPYVEHPDEFKQALFLRIAYDLAKSPNERICIPELAKAAGHPHPEAWPP